MAKTNPFRFSTKFQDDETDLLYYGYRYYNSSTGRWLSRDPIGEQGGVNLYAILSNATVNDYDKYGLEPANSNVSIDVPNWTYNFELQRPLPAGINGVTSLSINISRVVSNNDPCCCKLMDLEYTFKIQTKFAASATDATVYHENLHAYTDYRLTETFMALAANHLKQNCTTKVKYFLGVAAIGEESCETAIRRQLEAAKDKLIESYANIVYQEHAHGIYGEIGVSEGQDVAYLTWLERQMLLLESLESWRFW